MSIQIECENCGLKRKVKDQFAGKKIKCPECRSIIHIPDTDNSDLGLVDEKIPDEKYCPSCGEIIKKEAEICPHCGVRIKQAPQPVQRRRTRRPASGKSRISAGLLALFLGGFGAHKFYLGKGIQGLLYLLFCWTFIPGIVAFFEAIGFFIMSDASFERKISGTGTGIGTVAVWLIAGVFVLIVFGVVSQGPSSGKGSASKPESGLTLPSFGKQIVTYAEYKKITNGMSYRQVVEIIGTEGEEMSRSQMEGIPGMTSSIDTVMYQWVNGNGSNMNAMFQNDKLINKAQFGLK